VIPAAVRPRLPGPLAPTPQNLRLPDASFDVVTCTLAMHHSPRRQRLAATDPLGDLVAAAGYQVESWGKLPLLRYIVAVRPRESRGSFTTQK
jgi:hypothetical protein